MKKILIFIIALVGFVSCRSIKYVPVESVRHDSIYITKHQRDSIYVKDSILIVKGDTITEYRYKYIYQYKDRIDTVFVCHTDSIQVPYPVEKELTMWEKYKTKIVVIVMIFLFIMFVKFYNNK